MDAVTLVAAAVAIAIDDSRQAALNDVLLDRERAAMRAADAETQLAERVYNEAAQLRDVWRAARHQAARVARERAAAREQAARRVSELESEPADLDTRAQSLAATLEVLQNARFLHIRREFPEFLGECAHSP